jgi:RsiW-degrading membrane proteinase PrsW (M82 family)
MDQIEKEPVGMLVRLFIFGALACIPAAFIETFLEDTVLASILNPASLLSIAISNFIIVAGAEEGLKYLVLKKGTWNSPEFDHRFDAVVYSVAVTLGFAALENVLYVLSGGLSVALPRAILSIPGHCIFGIYMGYYYGLAKQYNLMGDKRMEKSYLRKAVLHPMLLHGFYDFCISTNYNLLIVVFLIYVVILDIVAFKKIRKLAREDHRLANEGHNMRI